MSDLTDAEAQATLNLRFPTSGATDHVAYSVNGTSEWAGLTRTPVGATGWASATLADPSVKANSGTLTSTAATAAATVTHAAIFSAASGGTQRTVWKALGEAKAVGIGDQLRHNPGQIQIRLT